MVRVNIAGSTFCSPQKKYSIAKNVSLVCDSKMLSLETLTYLFQDILFFTLSCYVLVCVVRLWR